MEVEPNLNAEVYRNATSVKNKIWMNDILEIYEDNTSLLCSNDLVGRIQDCLLSLYKSPAELLEKQAFTTLNEHITTSAAEFINSNMILVGDDSGTLKICSRKTSDGKHDNLKMLSNTIAHEDGITSVKLLTDSNNCVSSSTDLAIKVWDTNYLDDQFNGIRSFYPAHRCTINDLTVHPIEADVFGSCSEDGLSFIWDLRLETKPAMGLFKNEHALNSIAWKPNSSFVALGDCDGTFTLADVRCPGTAYIKMKCYETEIHDMKFCPKRPNLLAMCADSSIVKVVDVYKHKPSTVYEEDLHTDIVRGLAWDAVSSTLYTCGYDDKIVQHIIK